MKPPKRLPDFVSATTIALPLLSAQVWKSIADHPSLVALYTRSSCTSSRVGSIDVPISKSVGGSMELGAIPVIPEKTSCSGDARRVVVVGGEIKVLLGLLWQLKAAVTEDERSATTNANNVCKPLILIDLTSSR